MKLSKLNRDENLIGKAREGGIYKHGHLLASHAVLQERQHSLNFKQNSPYVKLAIDDFGFITINSYLGP